MRQLMPLRKVRLTSNKVVPFALANVTRETRTDDLRRAVHAHLHSPVCYFAREDWKPGVDTLIFHRGDQVRGCAGEAVRMLFTGGAPEAILPHVHADTVHPRACYVAAR